MLLKYINRQRSFLYEFCAFNKEDFVDIYLIADEL